MQHKHKHQRQIKPPNNNKIYRLVGSKHGAPIPSNLILELMVKVCTKLLFYMLMQQIPRVIYQYRSNANGLGQKTIELTKFNKFIVMYIN